MIFLLTLLFLFSPVLSQATTYYVAATGNNGNSGAEDAPWATIAFAATTMVAGDTTYVRGGTYNESGVRFRTTGTQASPIKLLAYPGELPILSCTASSAELNSITIRNNAGSTTPMGWITIDGLKIQNCNDGIKGENIHNSTFTHLWLLNNDNQGVLITGAHDNIFAYSIVQHSGDFLNCTSCTQQHGLYMSGKRWQIHHNVFVDNLAYGVQQNGSSSANNSVTVPDAEFRGAQDWVVSYNVFAYQSRRAGMVVWGSTTTNFRIENNIFYENAVVQSSGTAQGVDFVSATGVTGGSIKNNHFYASGSGGQSYLGIGPPTVYTNSGNVVNVSPPAFVNGGSNSLPASPDFRLTARAPVNIALANEYPNNGVVGPFQPPTTPTVASITTNKITVIDPRSAAVPVGNLSTTGVTFSCTANVCPGSPAVSSVSRAVGTDSHIEITLSGITSNACVSHADAVTVSYNSSTGSWTGNDNIGPYPGLHQKILSFTNVPVTNQCTGSGPPGGSASHVNYPMENGSGTTISDTSGNALHGTTSGMWVSGHTGFGVQVAGGTTQQTTIPYGSGVNPSTQSLTFVAAVYIPSGQTSTTRYVLGPELGTDQRGYFGAVSGTWRVGRQATGITAAGASNLSVSEGWQHLCMPWNSATDTVTLYKNGVAGTGGATGSYTSFTFATNFEFPIIGANLHTTVPEMIFDDVQIFTSVQDCSALYDAWNAPPPAPGGTLAQTAIQFQGVFLDTAGSPIVVGPSVQSIEVPKRGGAVLLFQVNCGAGTDCDQTAFKLVYTKNGSATKQQVPNTETVDGTWMWGVTTEASLNNGIRSTRLTGSCTMEPGATLVTADQIPSLAIPQDRCTVLAYVVHVEGVAGVDYFDYTLQTEAGLDLAGGYTQTARVRVVNPMASGIGF